MTVRGENLSARLEDTKDWPRTRCPGAVEAGVASRSTVCEDEVAEDSLADCLELLDSATDNSQANVREAA